MKLQSLVFAAAFAVAGCATDPSDAPLGPPSLDLAPGLPAPAQAQFYVDCIAQASQARTYDREANVIRFHCSDAPAQVFFDGLGPWSAEVGSEIQAGDTVWRFSTPIRENPSFVDFCRRTNAAAYDCTIVLNVGEFLAH